MLADELDYVIGVDTHRDQHALAVVDARTGSVVAQTTTAAEAHGYTRALRFAARHAPGARMWAIEGSGHYGAGLTRFLGARGEPVAEVGRSVRGERRLRGKDDPLGAIRAARSALATGTQLLPRAGQRQEALRLLLLARRSAVDVRRLALVQLRSVIVTAPERLREELRPLPVGQLIRRCSRFRRSRSRDAGRTRERARLALARAADRSRDRGSQRARARDRRARRALVPELLNETGVGPIVAAQLIVAWSHRDRVRSEACFARLVGVAPLPASSGQTIRHRLSRGGDRQLNRALHTVILHRRQHDAATRDYIARRIAEGKSTRDATRILKRYLARHLYRLMQSASDDLTVIGDSFTTLAHPIPVAPDV